MPIKLQRWIRGWVGEYWEGVLLYLPAVACIMAFPVPFPKARSKESP